MTSNSRTELKTSLSHTELTDSQGYIEICCLKQASKQTKKVKREVANLQFIIKHITKAKAYKFVFTYPVLAGNSV